MNSLKQNFKVFFSEGGGGFVDALNSKHKHILQMVLSTHRPSTIKVCTISHLAHCRLSTSRLYDLGNTLGSIYSPVTDQNCFPDFMNLNRAQNSTTIGGVSELERQLCVHYITCTKELFLRWSYWY